MTFNEIDNVSTRRNPVCAELHFSLEYAYPGSIPHPTELASVARCLTATMQPPTEALSRSARTAASRRCGQIEKITAGRETSVAVRQRSTEASSGGGEEQNCRSKRAHVGSQHANFTEPSRSLGSAGSQAEPGNRRTESKSHGLGSNFHRHITRSVMAK